MCGWTSELHRHPPSLLSRYDDAATAGRLDEQIRRSMQVAAKMQDVHETVRSGCGALWVLVVSAPGNIGATYAPGVWDSMALTLTVVVALILPQVMVDKQYLQKITAKERSRFEQQAADMDFVGAGGGVGAADRGAAGPPAGLPA